MWFVEFLRRVRPSMVSRTDQDLLPGLDMFSREVVRCWKVFLSEVRGVASLGC
jgi:hypothetical protein